MKKYVVLQAVVVILLLSMGNMAYSQGWLNKVKEKTKSKLIEKVTGEENQEGKEKASEVTGESDSGSDIHNTRGEGLVSTPPDVDKNLQGAEDAFKGKRYGQARDAVRQAILGIEMEMGRKVLEGLPAEINNLPKIPEEDKVASKQIGFEGLIIERVYRKDDQQFTLTIGNDAALLSAANMVISSQAYTEDPNQKRTTFKGYEAILEYDEYSGYELSVPFGQSSIMLAKGVNFSNEEKLMNAAENIDIEKIKKELGEQ